MQYNRLLVQRGNLFNYTETSEEEKHTCCNRPKAQGSPDNPIGMGDRGLEEWT